jgi:acetyl esterase/lipase/lysophospholipase L1-like esterase
LNAQQKVIGLYNGAAPGSEDWNWTEKELGSGQLVYNVSHPTLTVFAPDSFVATDAAVIVCPGGGFQFLSMGSEGYMVAQWLNKKGITAFVLKYRLAHSLTDNPLKEFMDKHPNSDSFNERIKPVVAMDIADGKTAVEYVREHATEYHISPDRIGIMGFSAGGTLVTGVAYNYNKESRPDFVAAIYPYVGSFKKGAVPDDAPPLFIAAASDDQFGFNLHCVSLYKDWVTSKHSAELHIYAKGGHGFGMNTEHLPTDAWIERFGDWLQQQGFAKNTSSSNASDQVANMQRILNDWPNIGRYAEANKELPPLPANEKRVVFMGNSITDAWINTDSDYFKNNPYIDRGISGQTTPQMLVRFSEDVINLKPAVVVILAGTNDIAGNTGPETLDEIFENIVAMTQLAKASHIQPVISSVLPAYDYPWRHGKQPAQKIVALNKMLKSYADQHHIVYLNYYDSVVDNRGGMQAQYSKDGVHPNLAGYKIMEPLADEAIKEALKRQ